MDLIYRTGKYSNLPKVREENGGIGIGSPEDLVEMLLGPAKRLRVTDDMLHPDNSVSYLEYEDGNTVKRYFLDHANKVIEIQWYEKNKKGK